MKTTAEMLEVGNVIDIAESSGIVSREVKEIEELSDNLVIHFHESDEKLTIHYSDWDSTKFTMRKTKGPIFKVLERNRIKKLNNLLLAIERELSKTYRTKLDMNEPKIILMYKDEPYFIYIHCSTDGSFHLDTTNFNSIIPDEMNPVLLEAIVKVLSGVFELSAARRKI